MKPCPHFERLGFTPDQIQSARIATASGFRNVAALVQKGELRCNDPDKYAAFNLKTAHAIESGESDNVFATWQKMNYHLTGRCEGLLA